MNFTSLVDPDLVETGFQNLTIQADGQDLVLPPSRPTTTYPYLKALLGGDNPPTPGLFDHTSSPSFNNNDISFSDGAGGSSLFSRDPLYDPEEDKRPSMFQFSSDLLDGHSR